MVYLYLIGSFIACFFSWKHYEDTIKSKKNSYTGNLEIKEVWFVILITLYYPMAIPMILFWRFLNLIYNKYFNKQQDEKSN